MNIGEFLHMGGHGFYVWSAYGFVAVLLVCNLLIPGLRMRRIRRRIGQHVTGVSS